MFEVGEIVYYIGYEVEKEVIESYMDSVSSPNIPIKNFPYTIAHISNVLGPYSYLSLKEFNGDSQFSLKFISEQEYQVSKRIEKLNKIKECLK